MESLGLPAPESLFGNVASATATSVAIVAAVEKFGYVGACIGSLAVATGRYFSGGLSIGDLFTCAKSHGIKTSFWLQKTYMRYPELVDINLRSNGTIALRKAQWAKRAA